MRTFPGIGDEFKLFFPVCAALKVHRRVRARAAESSRPPFGGSLLVPATRAVRDTVNRREASRATREALGTADDIDADRLRHLAHPAQPLSTLGPVPPGFLPPGPLKPSFAFGLPCRLPSRSFGHVEGHPERLSGGIWSRMIGRPKEGARSVGNRGNALSS